MILPRPSGSPPTHPRSAAPRPPARQVEASSSDRTRPSGGLTEPAHTNLLRSLHAVAERTESDAREISHGRSSSGRSWSRGAVGKDRAGATSVDGVGVTLLVDGESVYVGSNAFADGVDKVQYGIGQGPCLSAVAAGHIVSSTRIGSGERRWPAFSRAAARLMLRSVTSAPITADGDVVGSVNMYSRSPLGLSAVPPAVMARLADSAAEALSGARLLAMTEAGTRRLVEVLDRRSVIEHAVGLLMDRYVMGAGQARTLLTQLANQDGTTVADAARALTGLDDHAPGADPTTGSASTR